MASKNGAWFHVLTVLTLLGHLSNLVPFRSFMSIRFPTLPTLGPSFCAVGPGMNTKGNGEPKGFLTLLAFIWFLSIFSPRAWWICTATPGVLSEG